jgi:hypothetical protein
MDIIILRNVQPEDEKNLALALEKAFAEYADNVIVKIDEIRKQKKAEYDKQRYLDKKNSTMKNSEKSEISQEERENEKEDEKEKRTKKEKEEERVKEKEEIFNICAEPEKVTATEKPKPQKHAYGSGKNVLLTDDEYNKLRTQYPDADQKIENMSLYFLSKGTAGKYKSHYATFLNWERMAAERDAKQMQQMPKQIPKEKTFRDLRIEMENQEREQDASQDYFVDSFWRA